LWYEVAMGLQKTIINGAALFLAGAAVGFFGGQYLSGRNAPAERAQWAGATVSSAIVRNYTDTAQGTISGAYLVALKCMDTAPMTIEKEDAGRDEIKIKARLCERTAERTLKINPYRPMNIIETDIVYAIQNDLKGAVQYDIGYYRRVFGDVFVGGGVVLGGQSIGVKAGLRYVW